jgi:FAD/FMN-containing dehydrogenase
MERHDQPASAGHLRAEAVADIDVDHRLVTVGPGATLANVDRATVHHGLAVPLG